MFKDSQKSSTWLTWHFCVSHLNSVEHLQKTYRTPWTIHVSFASSFSMRPLQKGTSDDGEGNCGNNKVTVLTKEDRSVNKPKRFLESSCFSWTLSCFDRVGKSPQNAASVIWSIMQISLTLDKGIWWLWHIYDPLFYLSLRQAQVHQPLTRHGKHCQYDGDTWTSGHIILVIIHSYAEMCSIWNLAIWYCHSNVFSFAISAVVCSGVEL